MATIYRLTSVNLTILKTSPPILLIAAEGNTRQGGYTNCRLNPLEYVNPPADGIWEFTFEADEPTGTSTDVITDVKAYTAWEDYPKELKGVRIAAVYNKIEERLFPAPEFERIKGDLIAGVE